MKCQGMKYIVILFFCVSFFACCTPSITKTNYVPEDDVALMPFLQGSGYVNSINFEIMIQPQYNSVSHFVGNFAVVRKKANGKKHVINKNNETVLKKFYDITLFAAEDGKTVFALTETRSGLYFFRGTHGGSFGGNLRMSHHNSNYRLYNLSTGKLVMKKDQRWYHDDKPKIHSFDHYLTYDDDVYEIKNNGQLQKTQWNTKELTAKIIEERNLKLNELDFHYHNDHLFNRSFWYVDQFDMNAFHRIVPNHLHIKDNGYSTFVHNDKRHILAIRPINYDETHPLKKTVLLYEIRLETMEKDKEYIGLYNADENCWTVPLAEYKSGMEFIHVFENWVVLLPSLYWETKNQVFYNIRTRKKYQNMFSYEKYGNHVMNYAGHSDFFHSDREHNSKLIPDDAIIEDF